VPISGSSRSPGQLVIHSSHDSLLSMRIIIRFISLRDVTEVTASLLIEGRQMLQLLGYATIRSSRFPTYSFACMNLDTLEYLIRVALKV
jgi:hypothetical protein